MNHALIEQVRSFNRLVTQRNGALSERFLARARPLGQARVLWEIGPEGCQVRSLRARLDLDSGYLSRLLRLLERDGLVIVGPSPDDGRIRTARLTEAGMAERAELDRRAGAAAEEILRPLAGPQRSRLAAAMAEVERLLLASMVRIGPRPPGAAESRLCLRAYFDELAARFDCGYDPALGVRADDADLTPPAGDFLIAVLLDEPVGCGGVQLQAGGPAHIRRMWVSPAVRGFGVGRRLLAELEAVAAARGAQAVRLETSRFLTEAISLYRSAGYREVPAFNAEPYANHWFSKALR